MTGHRRERINRPIALVTSDFRQYHALAPFLAARGVELLGLAPNDDVPEAVAVLLDGPTNDKRSLPTRDQMHGTWVAMLVAARGGYRHATVGVDPGQSFGLALVVDNTLFDTATLHSPGAVLERIHAWADGLGGVWRMHVGDGSPRQGLPLMGAARSRWPQLAMATVTEQASRQPAPRSDRGRADAAIAIALREP